MKNTKTTLSQEAILHTPFLHIGAILLVMSPIVLITTTNMFLFWLYLIAGICLVGFKLIWAFKHRELLRKLSEKSDKSSKKKSR